MSASPLYGSSPLTRGKHPAEDVRLAPVRLIPAHAGKTPPQDPSQADRPAHPRSRGENAYANKLNKHGAGSSPLTRGKRGQERGCYFVEGLIPAHAGKTVFGWHLTNTCTAHPRSRGENSFPCQSRFTGIGSSPLTRGKPRAAKGVLDRERLIPAHAGKTPDGCATGVGRRAHPRSRGENVGSRPPVGRRLGSSPLTRGKRRNACRCSLEARLIPAHAGKTVAEHPELLFAAAHPRSRGENCRRRPWRTCGRGSSPLTRGKHIIKLTTT